MAIMAQRTVGYGWMDLLYNLCSREGQKKGRARSRSTVKMAPLFFLLYLYFESYSYKINEKEKERPWKIIETSLAKQVLVFHARFPSICYGMYGVFVVVVHLVCLRNKRKSPLHPKRMCPIARAMPCHDVISLHKLDAMHA